MTPNLPQKLWRPLAEVKSFVEKMPDGVDLTTLRDKVSCYASLNKKEKASLILFLEARESIFVIKERKENHVGREKTILRHKKFGYPKAAEKKAVTSVTQPKPVTVQEPVMTLSMPNSPEAIRKEAERLLQQAEEMERKRNDTDLFNKKLAPVKLEICQAAGALQRKTDEFIDCIDTLNKAIQKLKDLSA